MDTGAQPKRLRCRRQQFEARVDRGLGEHVLAGDMRLAGQDAAPRGPQQADEVGPQRGPARGVDGGRGEHGDLAGVGDQGGVAAPGQPPPLRDHHERGDEGEHGRGGPPDGQPLSDRDEQCEQGAQGIAQVLAEPATGRAGRPWSGARRRDRGERVHEGSGYHSRHCGSPFTRTGIESPSLRDGGVRRRRDRCARRDRPSRIHRRRRPVAGRRRSPDRRRIARCRHRRCRRSRRSRRARRGCS